MLPSIRNRVLSTLLWLVITAAAFAWIVPGAAQLSHTSPRSLASANLRQIGQATLIAASADAGRFPQANDVWTYARELALRGGLNDAHIWTWTPSDRARSDLPPVSTVLAADRQSLEPSFLASKPVWAVALMPPGLVVNSLPDTIPVAWTRGLRPDGAWAAYSPFGRQGGHIVFLSGNVRYFREIGGGLHVFGTEKTTSDVREALPPGTRIAEYQPTPQETEEWTRLAPSLLDGIRENLAWWPKQPRLLALLLGGLGTLWVLNLTRRLGTIPMVLFSLGFVLCVSLPAMVYYH